jgi:hypothetical protein
MFAEFRSRRRYTKTPVFPLMKCNSRSGPAAHPPTADLGVAQWSEYEVTFHTVTATICV